MRVPSRRWLLAGVSALAVASIPGRRVGRARAATATHAFRVGDKQVTVISDGTLSFGFSVALPSAPRQEAERLLRDGGLPIDGFTAETNVTLVRAGSELVLIDSGSGTNFQATAGKLGPNLEAAGIAPEAITRVVFTHAHPDHLWGAIDEFDNSPRYPNATYSIAAAEWDYWTDPGVVAKAPEGFQGMAAGSARILRALEKRIERRKAGDAIVPGMSLVETAGHTPGHVSVLIESGAERLLVGGDVITHPVVSFARPDWPWGTDADPDRAAQARRRTLDMLTSETMPLLGYHLPWPGLGRVERKDAAYRFIPG